MSSTKHIPTRKLGANGPQVSAIGFGAMGLGAFYGSHNADPFEVLNYAYDRGVTFWDTADIYGSSEVDLGKWFAKYPERRKDIFLATKFGAAKLAGPGEAYTPGPYSEPSYIEKQLNASLKSLQTDYIDLYYQHRIDPKVPVEVVLETIRPYVEKGTIKYIGLSECSVDTLKRAKAVKGIGEKVIAVQMEFSPFSLDIEKSGFVKAAQDLGVSIVAYSPLGRGMISGKLRSRKDLEEGDFRLSQPRFSEENFPKSVAVADEIGKIAQGLKITPSQVTLAWILAEYPDFIPIPGSRTTERIEENSSSAEIKLPADAVKAIRDLSEQADGVAGQRYDPANYEAVAGHSLPLDQWKGKRED